MIRKCIYAKDLAVITGKTPEICNKILREIRKIKNKKKNSPITIYEAADHLEMDVELLPILLGRWTLFDFWLVIYKCWLIDDCWFFKPKRLPIHPSANLPTIHCEYSFAIWDPGTDSWILNLCIHINSYRL